MLRCLLPTSLAVVWEGIQATLAVATSSKVRKWWRAWGREGTCSQRDGVGRREQHDWPAARREGWVEDGLRLEVDAGGALDACRGKGVAW